MRARLERLREESAARLADFEQALTALTRERASANDDDEHDPEGVPLSAEWSRLAGLAAAAREELRQVDEALTRWDAGSYGVCSVCGRRIPPARLDIRPFAEKCVHCAERDGG